MKRRVYSIQGELVAKSKEAALNAVATFNNPLTTFKSETFIVLMVISYTYLLHAYYRREGIDYCHHRVLPSGRKRYDRTRGGAKKHWELEWCLNQAECPLDAPTKANLRFLIGLRHQIEHQICLDLDDQLSGRYLAACLNYEAAITSLFGQEQSVGSSMSLTLQFHDLFRPVKPDPTPDLPAAVARYIQEFDAALPDEDFQSQRYAVRLLFTQKTANRVGQADRVLEFVPPGTELAAAIEREYWVLKEVERNKRRQKDVIQAMRDLGFAEFNSASHQNLIKAQNAKEPGKGYAIELGGQWFWYDRWLDVVRQDCEARWPLGAPAQPAEQAS